jgi:putative oxidoreductase
MKNHNANSTDWALLMLRVATAGLLVWYHGWAKFTGATGYLFGGSDWGFTGFVESIGFPLPAFFAVCAALAESIGCLMLAAGLFTRRAGVLVAATMSVAVYHHARTDMRIELASLYLLISLFFALAGAGKLSVDEWLRGRSKSAPVSEMARTIA